MTEAKSRTVLVASVNAAELVRLKTEISRVLADRNEVANFRESDHPGDLVKELKALHENLVTLVVISGFNGYWHRIFTKFEKIIETEVAAVLVNSNPDILQGGELHGLTPVHNERLADLGQIIGAELDKLQV